MPPPARPMPTPPMTVEAAGGAPMPGPDDAAGADPAAAMADALSELQNLGVQIQPGPNGTLILSGIPADVLGGGAMAPRGGAVGGGGASALG